MYLHGSYRGIRLSLLIPLNAGKGHSDKLDRHIRCLWQAMESLLTALGLGMGLGFRVQGFGFRASDLGCFGFKMLRA